MGVWFVSTFLANLGGGLGVESQRRAAQAWEDVATSNLVQVLLSRTVEGFVPNYASGPHISFDRITEIARNAIRDIGYEQHGFHWNTAKIEVLLHEQ